MSNWTRKTRYAGPPVKDKRKEPVDRAKPSPAPKPREYVLVTIERTEYRWTQRYPTKAAREQAKLSATKKAGSDSMWFKKNQRSRTVLFEEYEE